MRSRWILAAALGCGLVCSALAGCQKYSVEMRVDANGGGERVTQIDAESDLDAGARALLGLTGGWQEQTVEREEKPRLVHRFTRRLAVDTAAGWSTLVPDLMIKSDRDGRATLADRVSVEMRRGAAGRRCVYREVIGWQNLRETVADAFADYLDAALRDTLPELSLQTRSELRGLVQGYIIVGWADLAATDDHDKGADRLIASLATESARIAARGRSARDGERVAGVIRRWLLEPGGNLASDPLDSLPGIELAVDSSLELQVTLPGPIVDSNADEVKGRTAIWRVDLSKTLDADIDLHAEADLGP